jgi:hypothetical protein
MDSQPAGWVSLYTVRNLEDENELVSFGFFDGSLEDLRRSQQEFAYARQRANIDEFVEATDTDGIYEVVIEQGG